MIPLFLMHDRFCKAFLSFFLRRTGVMVEATEAFAFETNEEGQDPALNLVDHIRPDNSSETVREAARRAFLQLAQPTIETGKPAALGIEKARPGIVPQFCLIFPLVFKEQLVGVFGFICRCKDMDMARKHVEMVYKYLPRDDS